MGLGPPICTKCEIIYAFNNETNEWYCLKCGRSEFDMNLWEHDDREQIIKNTKKYTEENK